MIDTPHSIASNRNTTGSRTGTSETMVLWYNTGELNKRALTMLVAPSSPVHGNGVSVPMSTPKHTSDDLFGHLLDFAQTDEYHQIAESHKQAVNEKARPYRREANRKYRERHPEWVQARNELRPQGKPSKIVLAQFKSQRGKCWWCGCALDDTWQVDHRVPLSRGGTNDPANIACVCAECNHQKGDKMPWEWIGRLI